MQAYKSVLPVELYHQIIFFLDAKDIVALRKTCKYFHELTQDRSLWSVMFTCLRAEQALPCSRTEFMAMSPTQAERLLFSASQVEASFLAPRERVAHHIPAPDLPLAAAWRVLTFISDRFLLSANNDAVIIWDMSALDAYSAFAPSPWAHFTFTSFLGYVNCHSTLYIVTTRVRRGAGDRQSAVIYSVVLPPLGVEDRHRGLQREAEFPLREGELVKHVDPSSGRALLHLLPNSVQILHWHDGNRRSIISIELDDPVHGWSGITSLRFCGPYILCFRVRSVAAYPIPTDTPSADPLPSLRHRFGPVCFRVVSLSDVRVSRSPTGDVYTIFMLTNDVYQGMFHYRIRVTTSPPSMSVQVLAKGNIRPSEPLPFIPGTKDVRYTSEDIIRRTFFSSWSLGSAGMRGVWVDRHRGTIERKVVAFTTHPSRLKMKAVDSWPGDYSDEAPAIDGKVVHVISSFDLQSDVTICAVSEWTGRIALGSRVGAITIL